MNNCVYKTSNASCPEYSKFQASRGVSCLATPPVSSTVGLVAKEPKAVCFHKPNQKHAPSIGLHIKNTYTIHYTQRIINTL